MLVIIKKAADFYKNQFFTFTAYRSGKVLDPVLWRQVSKIDFFQEIQEI